MIELIVTSVVSWNTSILTCLFNYYNGALYYHIYLSFKLLKFYFFTYKSIFFMKNSFKTLFYHLVKKKVLIKSLKIPLATVYRPIPPLFLTTLTGKIAQKANSLLFRAL